MTLDQKLGNVDPVSTDKPQTDERVDYLLKGTEGNYISPNLGTTPEPTNVANSAPQEHNVPRRRKRGPCHGHVYSGDVHAWYEAISAINPGIDLF